MSRYMDSGGVVSDDSIVTLNPPESYTRPPQNSYEKKRKGHACAKKIRAINPRNRIPLDRVSFGQGEVSVLLPFQKISELIANGDYCNAINLAVMHRANKKAILVFEKGYSAKVKEAAREDPRMGISMIAALSPVANMPTPFADYQKKLLDRFTQAYMDQVEIDPTLFQEVQFASSAQ